MNTPNGYSEIKALFGNPANADGTLNIAWEDANIERIAPPAGWKLYYQDAPSPLIPIAGIRMHKLLAGSFTAVLQAIWDYAKQQLPPAATDDDIRAWLHNLRLDQTAGGFNFRPNKSNPNALSLHSFGIAIDWDADHNPRQKPLTRTLPDWWYNIWANHGWIDGRHFTTPDPMHVQFATGA